MNEPISAAHRLSNDTHSEYTTHSPVRLTHLTASTVCSETGRKIPSSCDDPVRPWFSKISLSSGQLKI
jgi:hypothetical protein